MGSRIGTQRGRSGKKWVGLNYKEKESAKEANGGIMPYTLSLVTSDFPHKTEWSEIDLPEILFYIQPPTSEYERVKIKDLIENGEAVVSDAPDGHNIRHFDILPRHISLEVPGWLVEAWRRIDTRIGYQDILDRQYADPNLGLKKHTKNALQNHCRRECRKVLNTWMEYGRRAEPHRTEVESIEELSYENIKFNTILKRSLIFPNRLVKVRLVRKVEDGLYYAIPREVTIDNWQDTTLPLDHFLPDGWPMNMTPEMHAAWQMSLTLMERAAVHGYEHWSKLDRSCLPVSWYDRTRTKSVPNDTYDGGCATCTWTLCRKLPSTPDIKLEPDEPSSTTNAKKRFHSEVRREMQDLGDTPKPVKRRYTTRLSSQRQNSKSGGAKCDSSRATESVVFVETYKRSPQQYEYYSSAPGREERELGGGYFHDDSKESPLANEDFGDKGSVCEEDEEDEEDEGVKDEFTPSPYSMAGILATDDIKANGMVRNVEGSGPFRNPSARRTNRQTSYLQVGFAAGGFSGPVQDSPQPGARLRKSNFLQSDSLLEDLQPSPCSCVEEATLLPADLDQTPGYLPASVFANHHSRDNTISSQGTSSSNLPYESSFFTSLTTQPGAFFSSSDASVSTAASSFTEASHTPIGRYFAIPNSTTPGFPAGQLYPLPIAESQPAVNGSAYHSPPEMAMYQTQMPFMSSPPRRPKSEWEWVQSRTRRHSDTDAIFGLPSNFADLGTFAYDPVAVSNYSDDHELGEALDLPLITTANTFRDYQALEGGISGGGEAARQGNPVACISSGQPIEDNSDNGFLEPQANDYSMPPSFLEV